MSAFARSRTLFARTDVSVTMVKWWKQTPNFNGQVTRSLSPYEQQIIVPWMKTWPKRLHDRFFDHGIWLTGSIALLWVISEGADQLEAADQFQHRY